MGDADSFRTSPNFRSHCLTAFAMHAGEVETSSCSLVRFDPEDLSTAPLRALAILGVTFALGFFYATILLGNSAPHTLVSPAGLRTGLIRFFEWENVHHVSQHGDLYSIYHRVNPA